MAKEIKDAKEIFQEKHGTIIMTESLNTRTKIKMSSLIKFQKNKTQFILCDCANEILFVEYDEEYEMADIAIFETRSSFETSKNDHKYNEYYTGLFLKFSSFSYFSII